jgi:two-component system nitrogen regulation response regulator GlnG
MRKLLIIDDEPNVLYSMRKALRREGLEVETVETGAQGIAAIRTNRPDAVILDVRLPDGHGLDFLDQIFAIDPRLPVIVVTAFSSMETAVEAMKRGAYEYLLKPIELDELREKVDRALEIATVDSSTALLAETREHGHEQQIVGRCPAMQEVFKSIGRIARQDITVLIQGESGSGKELIADAIYRHSTRSSAPFLAVNCAALQETILESELFGHERGAFTGAEKLRIGKFEQVDGGTLFLDEVGDMSPATQAKVLRLLQDGTFQRVGGNETQRCNVRILAATNRDLEEMVAEGTFREDLFYRLRGFVIHVPPLRERPGDLELLMSSFLRRFNDDLGRHVRVVTPEALRLLEMHRWPGNVRELQITVRYAILHAVGDTITSGSLPSSVTRPTASTASIESSDDVEGVLARWIETQLAHGDGKTYRNVHSTVDRVLLKKALEYADSSQVRAAQALGIARSTLRNRLSELEMEGDLKDDAAAVS